MGSRIVNVCLIGAGTMGRIHARNLASLIPRAKLVAIADIDRPSAEGCARECGAAVVYDRAESALEHPGLEGVVICTPPVTHASIV